ncbi:MAG: hypothetical protein ACP5NQ_05845 [Vulcanisaeta sp.]
MSMDIPEDLRRVIEEIVNAKLSNIKGKTETLAFVDSVIEEVKKRGFTLNDDLEAMARPYVVDVLWSLKKKGVISMDEDLLHFTVTRQET